MRHLFYPPYGMWLHGDCSQAEMRGAGFVARDEVLIDEYAADIDRHEDTRCMIEELVGWDTISRANPMLKDPKHQRVGAKVINFNILFTHDPMSIEYNMHKQGIFGIGKEVLEPIFEEIHTKYNNISNYKYIYNPIEIIKNKYITNYVRRRRRFDGIAWLYSPEAEKGLKHLQALAKVPDLQYGTDYTTKKLKEVFPKEIMDLFMEGWNFHIQGPFSGDIPKLIVSCVARKWKKEGVRATPFLTLYDSVEIACDPADIERAVALATPYFLAPPIHMLTDLTPIWTVVPLGVDWSVGPNWGTQFGIDNWEEDFEAYKGREEPHPQLDLSHHMVAGCDANSPTCYACREPVDPESANVTFEQEVGESGKVWVEIRHKKCPKSTPMEGGP
ncbi:MAG: DNA polymerase [Dehalococcoidia bacterium]